MRNFIIDCFLSTIFVFLVLFSLREISELNIFNAFDPIGESLGDMEITDINFSRMREDPPIDTNIVMVNIGYLSRAEIAQQIRIISKYNPKVIGIDSFFNCGACVADPIIDSLCCPQAYDTLSLMLFREAIKDAGNVVMVTKVTDPDSLDDLRFYGLERTDSLLRPFAYEGFANLDTDAEHQEDLKSCRNFNPTVTVGDSIHHAFAVRMAMLYDSVKAKNFLARNNDVEVINYRGNIYDPFGAGLYPGRYYTVDWYQALDEDSFVPELFRDKIVILGFLGGNLDDTSWDDKFFTPLNKNYAGKTRPDMFGAVVHANIVSMILNEDYIEEVSLWIQILIAVSICIINNCIFIMIERRIPLWFDGLSILMQMTQIVLGTLLMIYFFHWFEVKLDLTVTLAVLAVCGTCFELYAMAFKRIILYSYHRWITKDMDSVYMKTKH